MEDACTCHGYPHSARHSYDAACFQAGRYDPIRFVNRVSERSRSRGHQSLDSLVNSSAGNDRMVGQQDLPRARDSACRGFDRRHTEER